MFQGTVKTWLTERAFGFIRSDEEAQRDVFIHASNLPAGITGLEICQRVTFDVEPDKRDERRFRPSTSNWRHDHVSEKETSAEADDLRTWPKVGHSNRRFPPPRPSATC